MRKLLLTAAFCAAAFCQPVLAESTVSGTVLQKEAAAIDFTETIDLTKMKRFSIQAVYSDGTPASFNFTDGRYSTATLTLYGSTTTLSGKRIGINGVVLDEGDDWTAATSSAVTAANISDAIVANATLASIVTSTHSTGIVTVTATTLGLNAYSLFTSTPYALSWNEDQTEKDLTMLNGAATDIDVTNDDINVDATGLTTGFGVLYSTAGTGIGGLTDQTTYYAIIVDGDEFGLATSTANAVAGTLIDLTTTSATGNGTYTLTPVALNGNPSFKWQQSNDSSSWNDIDYAILSTFTWSSAGSTYYDFGTPNYRYLRINYTHPNAGQGGLYLKYNWYGIKED